MAWMEARRSSTRLRAVKFGVLFILAVLGVSCTAREDRIRLVVDVPGRTMSKFPFVLAEDRGLYEKYGLDVELQGPVGFWPRFWRRLDMLEESDITVEGHTPQIFDQLLHPERVPVRVALAATDCSVRSYVIGRPGLKTLEEIKGKRLGMGNPYSTSGSAGMMAVSRMGWDPKRDITIVNGSGIEDLAAGRVDAVMGDDDELEVAQEEGFPVLVDTRVFEETLPGNSVLVSPEWLEDPTHREAARRFLMATAEAVALYHQNPELVLDALMRLYGFDRETAEGRYNRTDYIPRKPFPCVDGVVRMMELHDLELLHQYTPQDLYDDSLMRELDESGFLDSLYN